MNRTERIQQLSAFRVPQGFRGRPAWIVQLWWLVQSTVFRFSPRMLNGFRCALLRSFGAQVGPNVLIRPSARFTYPWRISIGSNCWVGEHAIFYSLGRIELGDDSVVSQFSHLCAGDHDYRQSDFPIRGRDIRIGAEVWIAADVFVGPGVAVGDGAVVGARSSVFHDVPAGMVCAGNPCRVIRPRRLPKMVVNA